MKARGPRPHLSILSLLLALAGAPASARDAPLAGSAIVPSFSLQHETMRPGEEVTLAACVTNVNARSSRDLMPGDAFVFDLTAGTVHGCASPTVFAPDGSLDPSDADCATEARRATLTYTGPARAFPLGAMICADIAYAAGDASSSVAVHARARNEGAIAAPPVEALVLNVGDLGSVGPPGPPGPSGPAGPAGPPGPSGVGAAAMAVSTSGVTTGGCGGPVVDVPGLSTSIVVQEGSLLSVALDAIASDSCPGIRVDDRYRGGRLALEVDGVVVARRDVPYSSTGGFALNDYFRASVPLLWLSPPLGAGPHAVRVLLEPYFPPNCDALQSMCIGGGPDDPGLQARLLLAEIRQ